MSKKAKDVKERIDLPGGWYFAKLTETLFKIYDPNGVSRSGVWYQSEAEAFAAAMRDEPAAPTMGEQLEGIFACKYAAHQFEYEPAAPVTDDEDHKTALWTAKTWLGEKPSLASMGLDKARSPGKTLARCYLALAAKSATPPGDVAMQAARTPDVQAAMNLMQDITFSHGREMWNIIKSHITQLEAAQAPAVCQSDEDVSGDIFRLIFSADPESEDRDDIEKSARVVARHRQAHEAAAWQKGCEYMREAAEDETYNHSCEGYVCDCKGHIAHAIRALPIPPAPTGGQDNG